MYKENVESMKETLREKVLIEFSEFELENGERYLSSSVSFVSKPFEVQRCGLGLSLGTFSNLIMDKCVKLLL